MNRRRKVMEINVANFVNKDVTLTKSKAIWSLYEAISNSIHAESTEIKIIIEHEKTLPEINFIPKLKNIKIIDNGIGFTQENFISFNNAFDSNKITGKGKGRFFFLKAFSEIKVYSIYKEENKVFKREFDFKKTKNGVENLKIELLSEEKQTGTTIELKSLNKDYSFPKETYDIIYSILIHFLLELKNNDKLEIDVEDDLGNKISLREDYNLKIASKLKSKILEIKNNKFTMDYLLVSKIEEIKKSYLILTGENREVIKKELGEESSSFKGSFKEEKYVLAYLSGEYLEERINTDRDGFDFSLQSKLGSNCSADPLTLEEIYNHVVKTLKNIYSEEINEIIKEKKEKMNKYFEKAINLSDKLIFDRFEEEILDEINSKITNQNIEKIFDEKKRNLKKEVSKEIKNIAFGKESYKDDIKKLTQKIDVSLQATLVDYVIQRKAILNLYFKLLKGNETKVKTKTGEKKNYEFSLEKDIHNLVFPMKNTSDKVDYSNHNLWLIDDSLAFQSFIASDLELKNFTKNSEDRDRPDLLFFSEYDSDDILDSVTIIEFKRPEVDTTQREETPHYQVMNYVKKMRNKEITLEGKELKTTEKTRFYCYIILDLNKKNETVFNDLNYIKLMNDVGYTFYHNTYNMYVTVYDFRSLGKMAERRNKVFFEKLGINK